MRMLSHLTRRTRNEAGATSSEYALIISLVAVAILVAVAFFGRTVSSSFANSCSQVASAAQNSAC